MPVPERERANCLSTFKLIAIGSVATCLTVRWNRRVYEGNIGMLNCPCIDATRAQFGAAIARESIQRTRRGDETMKSEEGTFEREKEEDKCRSATSQGDSAKGRKGEGKGRRANSRGRSERPRCCLPAACVESAMLMQCHVVHASGAVRCVRRRYG